MEPGRGVIGRIDPIERVDAQRAGQQRQAPRSSFGQSIVRDNDPRVVRARCQPHAGVRGQIGGGHRIAYNIGRHQSGAQFGIGQSIFHEFQKHNGPLAVSGQDEGPSLVPALQIMMKGGLDVRARHGVGFHQFGRGQQVHLHGHLAAVGLKNVARRREGRGLSQTGAAGQSPVVGVGRIEIDQARPGQQSARREKHVHGFFRMIRVFGREGPGHIRSIVRRGGNGDVHRAFLLWATHSPTMLTAISPGVSAPMGKPIGQCTRASAASDTPLRLRASYTASRLRRLPIMPI